MFVFVNPGGVVGAPALVSCFILSIFLDVTVFTEVSGFSEVLGVTCTDLFTLAMELAACTPVLTVVLDLVAFIFFSASFNFVSAFSILFSASFNFNLRFLIFPLLRVLLFACNSSICVRRL